MLPAAHESLCLCSSLWALSDLAWALLYPLKFPCDSKRVASGTLHIKTADRCIQQLLTSADAPEQLDWPSCSPPPHCARLFAPAPGLGPDPDCYHPLAASQ